MLEPSGPPFPGGGQQMLKWTHAGSGTRLMMLVHHDDAQRE